jgi:hypothetical protein
MPPTLDSIGAVLTIASARHMRTLTRHIPLRINPSVLSGVAHLLATRVATVVDMELALAKLDIKLSITGIS